jgi:hypothetical protein
MSAEDRFFCHSPMGTALLVDSFVGWGKLTGSERAFSSAELNPK